ncbi:ABC transporter ATP-binding protein [Sphingobium phenoxybenzoativorans]|uniref:ABC transporter ATP-binding protein n=1 Tax=Sphingobium phenoxybenzoativorans TaxID=1592790 RepID=A0A975Q186_9SPHN|nr:ABC transporter ATP-binding protein [Sphingobium phenoxybenzoativorans]QUT05680.1 ABC transporter ATP-binding protein [Sphingobium phenoxybenzoativorans]
MTPVVQAEHISKLYRLGQKGRGSLRESVSSWSSRLLGAAQHSVETDYWALRDVSFKVAAGEAVGIIGKNGAGKSTLLKILSRITPPTSGTVAFQGNIGSLLEVGTGFHPDLSGRDNVFLNGIILGMSRRDVARRFDEIVAFAEIEQFIDTPVKRYSSGMYLRLAFAVAAHLDSDILLVDEVLAVGDAAFQRKCLSRMEEVTSDGRAILFVSHNLTAIQALCSRTMWINDGLIAQDGPTKDVLGTYLRTTIASGQSHSPHHRVWTEDEAPSSGQVSLVEARLSPIDGASGEPIDVDTAFTIELLLNIRSDKVVINPSISLMNEQDIIVFDSGPTERPVSWTLGMHHLRCDIPAHLLNDGVYRIALRIYEDGDATLSIPELLLVEVLDSLENRHGWYGKWDGVVRPALIWQRNEIRSLPHRLP